MITVRPLHFRRVADQIQTNLIQLQQDLRRNAQQHKAWAQAQTHPRALLVTFIADCVTQYVRRIAWVRDAFTGPNGAALIAYFATLGWTESETRAMLLELEGAVIALRDAPRATYANIVTACDALLAAVDPVPSLWPE